MRVGHVENRVRSVPGWGWRVGIEKDGVDNYDKCMAHATQLVRNGWESAAGEGEGVGLGRFVRSGPGTVKLSPESAGKYAETRCGVEADG